MAGGDGACYGPRFGPLYAEEVNAVKDKEGREYLLVKLEAPPKTDEKDIGYFLISPRYVGDTVDNIRIGECTVGVWAVKPGNDEKTIIELSDKNAEYWSIGTCWSVST